VGDVTSDYTVDKELEILRSQVRTLQRKVQKHADLRAESERAMRDMKVDRDRWHDRAKQLEAELASRGDT
jgi:hypothetical protein